MEKIGIELSRYESFFTGREKAIIRQRYRYPLTDIDISRLIDKALDYGFYDLAEYIYTIYGDLFHPSVPGEPTEEEALAILDALTPDDLKENK